VTTSLVTRDRLNNMLSLLRRPGAFNRILHLRTFSTRQCLLAPYTVKVPQMAESISEGTLRTWSKRVGESVAMDEEVATIETDKVGRYCYQPRLLTNCLD
jgi:Biotin-requiring enzyme